MSRKCLFPFSNIVLNPSGSVSPCCKYNLNKVDTEIDTETLHDKTIQELFYQPAMEKIRNDFLNGVEPEACKACWDEESAGITSLRQHRENVSKWHRHKGHKYPVRYQDPKIITMDLKFSSLCNLKCRICGPYCSSNWLKESLDTGEYHEHTIKIFSKYAERKFIKNELNFETFKELIPDLHIIEFYGGEPLMQPEHARIMEMLSNYPDIRKLDIELFYNTNGTIYDEAVSQVWDKMALVEFNISLDDIGPRFEYQRHPAKWDEVVSNIKKYQANSKSNVSMSLYCTISMYNIFYIDELIKFNAENLKLNLKFNLLHWPDKMSIKNLPTNIKNIIKAKVEKLDAHSLSYVQEIFGIKEVLAFMLDNEGSSDNLAEFIKVTNLHDDYRNESFATTFPEYWSLLNESN
jgi:sulfatase maturation enzyme AslB (radical SAM superfamily)